MNKKRDTHKRFTPFTRTQTFSFLKTSFFSLEREKKEQKNKQNASARARFASLPKAPAPLFLIFRAMSSTSPSDDELMRLVGEKLKKKEREKKRCEEDLSSANAKLRKLEEEVKLLDALEREVRSLKRRRVELETKNGELEGLDIQPFPLWKLLTDVQYRYIFEKHILKKLDELDFRVFREVNTESRDAIRRSKRKLQKTHKVNIWTDNPPAKTQMTRKFEGKEAQYFFCSYAAYSGNLALLRWLREEKKFDWNDRTINAAAGYGHLHIVKYCMEHKCPIHELACAFAAQYGHLDILKYLHENGAPWNSWTCSFARENNQLECLNYAKQNGCPDTMKP